MKNLAIFINKVVHFTIYKVRGHFQNNQFPPAKSQQSSGETKKFNSFRTIKKMFARWPRNRRKLVTNTSSRYSKRPIPTSNCARTHHNFIAATKCLTASGDFRWNDGDTRRLAGSGLRTSRRARSRSSYGSNWLVCGSTEPPPPHSTHIHATAGWLTDTPYKMAALSWGFSDVIGL